MARLEGKNIIVTGSSRGLGRAFAIAMAAEGANVVVNGTNQGALEAVARDIRNAGGSVIAVAGSVAEESVAQTLVARCDEAFGSVDVLVNNAGIVRDRTMLKMSMDEFDEVVAVNLRGAFACMREAGRAMRETGGGQIIQIISNSGLTGGFGQANYAASKAGMMGLLRTAVLELSRFSIRTNAVWPIAATDMTEVVFERAAAAAKERGEASPEPSALGFGTPEEVAAGLVWLASDAAAHLNGQCVTFNGRKTALWTHPEERHVTFRDTPFSVDDLADHYRDIEPLPIHQPQMQPRA